MLPCLTVRDEMVVWIDGRMLDSSSGRAGRLLKVSVDACMNEQMIVGYFTGPSSLNHQPQTPTIENNNYTS